MGWCGTPIIISWIRQQLSELLPQLSWKDSVLIKQNNLGYIIHSSKKAETIYKFLQNFNLKFRLDRKWRYQLS
jgi:hypothetical protein